MVNKRYDLLRIQRFRVRAETFLVNYDDILWIFILTSSGQFQAVSDGKRFRCKSTSFGGILDYHVSEEYKDFEKKKYFELVSQGWRPISGAHELEFTENLYRESSDPRGKSLDELETMLRRMLLLKDRDAQKVFTQLGGSLKDGEEIVEKFVWMIVQLRKRLERNDLNSLEQKLLLLLKQGVITPEEYEAAKRKLFSS
jgi:hypothetical protein